MMIMVFKFSGALFGENCNRIATSTKRLNQRFNGLEEAFDFV
jgi:hypothetical protein